MNELAVGVYTIGQTPRPDLTEPLALRCRCLGRLAMDALEGTLRDAMRHDR